MKTKKDATVERRFELIGWLGFALIIGAYLLITLHQLSVNSVAYHMLNLCGAVCMMMNARNKQARPLFWLNAAWALIAVLGLTN